MLVKTSELGRHKHKHKHKKNGQVRSSCATAYVLALTMSENWVDIDKHKADLDQL